MFKTTRGRYYKGLFVFNPIQYLFKYFILFTETSASNLTLVQQHVTGMVFAYIKCGGVSCVKMLFYLHKTYIATEDS